MIRISGLSKEYGPLKAVDNLNLEIKEAEIFGLLGPNGAGKTTTIQMLNTLTLPTSGRAEIAGLDLVSEANKVKRMIGVSPQEMNLCLYLGVIAIRRANR